MERRKTRSQPRRTAALKQLAPYSVTVEPDGSLRVTHPLVGNTWDTHPPDECLGLLARLGLAADMEAFVNGPGYERPANG